MPRPHGLGDPITEDHAVSIVSKSVHEPLCPLFWVLGGSIDYSQLEDGNTKALIKHQSVAWKQTGPQ